jgi:hypothetical protein
MSGFLSSLKADLLDRRLLPVVAVVGVALVAALAFIVLGGGSSGSTPPAPVSSGPAAAAGLPITTTTPQTALAETTGGVSAQHRGVARDPFTPLPQPKAKKASSASAGAASKTTTASSSSGAGASSGSGSAPKSSGEPAPATTPKPTNPAKPKTVYHAALLFGVIPPGSTPQSVKLTPYENLKLLAPLPSAKQPLVVFRGVTAGGKSATFTLVGEAILHGQGTCLPSATQCEALDVGPGQSEQLEYLPASGPSVTYELRVVNIASTTATSASAKRVLSGESKAGRALLSRAGLVNIPGLHYSSQPGVLVFAKRSASAARAQSAGHRRHRH